MATLGDPQVREFLSYGTRTGKLAYLARSGRPLVAPVWFIVEGDSLLRTATAIGARYMGTQRADEFGERNSVPGELVVRLQAVKVVVGFDLTG